jgi:hypothetical protein
LGTPADGISEKCKILRQAIVEVDPLPSRLLLQQREFLA